jgi:hypothetical protein
MNVQELIEIHCVTEGEEECGWIHTHGMADHGCAELEIRKVPLFLMEEAAALLNDTAEYMIELARAGGKVVQLGETMGIGNVAFRFVKLEPIVGSENHFEVERWALSDEPMRGKCAGCDAEDCPANVAKNDLH